MNLADVRAEDIDFSEMAEALSKIARFNGRPRGPAYPVAQHCVMGADALFAEQGDAVAAGYFLLHDGHEYLLGDTPRPAADLYHHLHSRRKGARGSILEAIAEAKHAIDLAIWERAGLPPIDRMPAYRRQVEAMDLRMMRAEAIALFGPRAGDHVGAADLPPPRLTGAIRAWAAGKAEEAFLDRLARYLDIDARAAA